jgi:hypothetical protein
MKFIAFALAAFAVLTTPAFAEPPPYPTPDERAPVHAECLSVNAFGTRFLGRQFDEERAFDETLYQCYLHTDELRIRSCRVIACRTLGGAWKKFP